MPAITAAAVVAPVVTEFPGRSDASRRAGGAPRRCGTRHGRLGGVRTGVEVFRRRRLR